LVVGRQEVQMSRFGIVLFALTMPALMPAAALSRPKRVASPAPTTCKDRKECEKACARDDASACFALGERLLVKESALEAADPGAAGGFFLAACEHGHAEACLELARLRAYGLGGPIDAEASAAATREACNRGLEPACGVVAENSFFAFGQRRDSGLAHLLARRSEAASKKACAGGDGLLCALLADLSDAGLVAGGPAAVRAFREEARHLLEPRCERDDAIACLWLGGTEPPGSTRSTAALRRSCELGVARACSAVGWALFSGHGVAQDGAQAMAHWKTGCEASDPRACDVLCSRLTYGDGVEKDEAAARPYCERAIPELRRGCDLGSGVECAVLARHYQKGLAVRADLDRATALFTASVDPLRSACEGHDALACSYLAYLYDKGLGVPKDLAARLQIERNQCDSGDGASCFAYAERLRSGDQVERSRERAKFYDNQACAFGHRPGCAAAAASQTIAQKTPSPPLGCMPGQTAEEGSPNHCCYARQVWSDKDQRCVGEPACPEGMSARDGTCRQDPEADDAEPEPKPAPKAAPARQEQPSQPPAAEKAIAAPEVARVEEAPAPKPDCSSCAGTCANLTARCQTNMGACYEAAACLCRCERDRGGCGLSISSLDQCIADNGAQVTRLSAQSQTEHNDRAQAH
jgi:TPR repeat protein